MLIQLQNYMIKSDAELSVKAWTFLTRVHLKKNGPKGSVIFEILSFPLFLKKKKKMYFHKYVLNEHAKQ